MREDGEISILGHWPADSQDHPATLVLPEQKGLNLQPEWAKARQRVELYLEALCVPVEQRPLLTDRAMALAWNKTGSHGSILAAAMSALHQVLEESSPKAQSSAPAGSVPSGAPLTHQRAMVPDSRAFPQIDRSPMLPNSAAFSRGLRTTPHGAPSSGTRPLRFILPPGFEHYFF